MREIGSVKLKNIINFYILKINSYNNNNNNIT